jgi:hypothetical protein
MPLRLSCSRLAQLWSRGSALAAIALLTTLASRAEAAAPPGQWWNAAYAERLNVTVTGRGAAAAAQYSMYVTIDHARMVSTGRSLASGDDVRVVYWNGSGWVELERLEHRDLVPHPGRDRRLRHRRQLLHLLQQPRRRSPACRLGQRLPLLRRLQRRRARHDPVELCRSVPMVASGQLHGIRRDGFAGVG